MLTSSYKSYRVAFSAMVLASVLAGCSTDVQLINRGHKAREAGIQLYNEGNYAEAAGAFKNAARQDTRDYKSYYYMGASYEALKQYEQANQAYKTALDVTHRSLEGQENRAFRIRIMDSLASLLARTDDRGVEKAELEKQAASRKTGEWYLVLAKTYRASGDPDSAVEAYNRGFLIDTKDFDLAKDYGLFMVQIGQTHKAISPLRRANAIDPRDPQVAAAMRQIGLVPGEVPDDKDIVQPVKSSVSDVEAPKNAAGTPKD